MRMQRAAAATMPTTMPVVLLLSRTTSDGPGNTFTSGRGGRAVKGEGRHVMFHHSLWHTLLIWITCQGGGQRAGARGYSASSWWIIWHTVCIMLHAGFSLEPYYHIMRKQITLHHVERRAKAQVSIISIFVTHIWHFMTYTSNEGCCMVIYDTTLNVWSPKNLHMNSLGCIEMRWGNGMGRKKRKETDKMDSKG